MRLKRSTLLSGSAALLAVNTIASPARAAFEYKFATNTGMDDPRTSEAAIMCEKVTKQSGGRLAIKLYPNGTLGGDTAMLEQVRAGALEFMAISPGILSAVVPVAGIEGIPFAFKTTKIALSAYDGALGDYVRKEVEAKNIVVMPKYIDNGYRQITSSVKPVRVADDLAGLKIRTPPGKIWIDTFKAFGATPVGMNWSELYTALQTRLVEAQENPYAIIEAGRLYEVQKYLSVTNHMWGGFFVIGNPDRWKALGPDLQKFVTAHMNEYALRQRRAMAAANEAMADKLQRQGMAFNTADVTTFKARLKDSYGKWKIEYGATAWELLERYAGKLA